MAFIASVTDHINGKAFLQTFSAANIECLQIGYWAN